MAEPRYAIYYAPAANSALAQAGASWLGRDALGGQAVPQIDCPPLSGARFAAITEHARRYGLHGTLKPPFALAHGHSLDMLDQALRRLAPQFSAFDFLLGISLFDAFMAAVPLSQQSEIAAIAARCVSELDAFRLPAGEDELRRRRTAGLTPEQDAMLLRWGYPYVMDCFQFHVTLSDGLREEERQPLLHQAQAWFAAPLALPQAFDALSLFVQPSAGANFNLIARYGFDGSVDYQERSSR